MFLYNWYIYDVWRFAYEVQNPIKQSHVSVLFCFAHIDSEVQDCSISGVLAVLH